MPSRPNIPCNHPGCPRLISYGKKYCSEHEELHRNDRRSSGGRGYGSRWQKARRLYLQTHPLCVNCEKDGQYTKATVVDHIKPHRGDPILFWDENNWQSLCKACHDKKTWNEDNLPEYRF